MANIIPTFQSKSSRWSMQMELDGTVYTLWFSWNDRAVAWYLDLYLSDGETRVLCGLKLVVDYDMLLQYHALPGCPPGQLFLADQEAYLTTAAPTYDDFGERYLLVYIPEA